MGKNNLKEVIKRLKEEIEKTTDPETVIRLTEQLTKVLPKKRRVRPPLREPKSNPIPKRPIEGSAVDDLSDDEWLIHKIVVRAEEIVREAKRQGLPVPTGKEACAQAMEECKSGNGFERYVMDLWKSTATNRAPQTLKITSAD